jgi:transposase-like protein
MKERRSLVIVLPKNNNEHSRWTSGEEDYAMKRSTPVEREKQEPVIRDMLHDPLTDLIRQGARKIVFEALNAEIEDIVGMYRDRRMPDGSPSVVRNGYLPEREIMTGMGPIAVTVPRIRDRGHDKDGKITFSSSIVPPYVRKARDFESVIPWLYLRGVSTGNFQEALAALVGPQAAGLSPSTISRLKNVWYEEYKKWSSRSLAGKRYIYVWADGIYFGARMEDEKSCMLVLIGVTEDGRKELIGIMDGYRESSDSWSELLRDIKERGLEDDPMLAVGDGALGFWKAL